MGASAVTAENLKNTWESIFLRKGGNGVFTRLFDSLDPGKRSTLLAALKLRETELPVIGSLGGPGNWLILTTERLVWGIDDARHEISVATIRDATANLKEFQHSQSKLEMKRLRIITLGGDEHTIELEPGRPLSGTWNVLKNVGARNRHITNDIVDKAKSTSQPGS
jgi:hypothetical protein